ncbi:hypothetical protein AVL62_08040 [Serinicoccus chungangensis]|uniref:DUF2231 domain-containing protein n=1 Tax=Serinicoccus chungangensis TaxID=767452 RepID=A0A0W8I2Q2_9MICO|nr:DUF2231 domain-containing protein [Serinicoccus chungangensis]KUG51882.1 hypothetical protein AVL62_08040 [Serinicoccus chungangensis]
MVMGLPVHPLLVHFAVVLLLLAGGAQLLVVLVPRFRRWFGWGMPLLAVVAAVVTRVTQSYGDVLLQTVGSSQVLQEHGAWGVRAGLAGILLAVLSVLHWVATSPWGRSHWAARWPERVGTVLGALAAAAAVWAVVAVTLAGHTGATSVWGG